MRDHFTEVIGNGVGLMFLAALAGSLAFLLPRLLAPYVATCRFRGKPDPKAEEVMRYLIDLDSKIGRNHESKQ